MAEDQRLKLARTIFTQYREHWGLFWRIMIPVAIVAIPLSITIFFWRWSSVGNPLDNDKYKYKTTSRVGTGIGAHPTFLVSERDTPEDTSEKVMKDPVYPPGVHWMLLPLPYFSSTNDAWVTWRWRLSFRSVPHGPYNSLALLLLTLCPLSLAVARISRGSEGSSVVQDLVPITAREAWRQTGHKALTVLGTSVLFVLIIFGINKAGDYFGKMILQLILPLMRPLGLTGRTPIELWIIPYSLVWDLFLCLQFYFMATMSLCNLCIILENRSIIAAFRRSHALVSGARWRFFGIYLLTGWIALVITSVLLGAALLVLSVFIPELVPIREALSPLIFLTLFIGSDVLVVLPELLSGPIMVAIFVVSGLITTFLVPIWAILTTHLYFERVDAIKKAA